MEVVSSKPLSILEVREILEKREKEGELSYEQQQVLEYSKKFGEGDIKEIQALAKKLEENKKLTKEAIVKIIDIRPKKLETLRLIVAKDKIELSEEELNEILELINK